MKMDGVSSERSEVASRANSQHLFQSELIAGIQQVMRAKHKTPITAATVRNMQTITGWHFKYIHREGHRKLLPENDSSLCIRHVDFTAMFVQSCIM